MQFFQPSVSTVACGEAELNNTQKLFLFRKSSHFVSCKSIIQMQKLPSSILQKLSGEKIVLGSISCCKGKSKATEVLLQKEQTSEFQYFTEKRLMTSKAKREIFEEQRAKKKKKRRRKRRKRTIEYRMMVDDFHRCPTGFSFALTQHLKATIKTLLF